MARNEKPRNESLLKPWNFGPLDPFSAGLCMRPGAPFTRRGSWISREIPTQETPILMLSLVSHHFPHSMSILLAILYILYIHTWKYILDFQSDPSRWNWFLGGFHVSFWGCKKKGSRLTGDASNSFQGKSRLVDDDRIFMGFKYQNYGDIVDRWWLSDDWVDGGVSKDRAEVTNRWFSCRAFSTAASFWVDLSDFFFGWGCNIFQKDILPEFKFVSSSQSIISGLLSGYLIYFDISY